MHKITRSEKRNQPQNRVRRLGVIHKDRYKKSDKGALYKVFDCG